MSYQAQDFKTAIDLDLAAAQLNERLLGARLGVSQQAISKWKLRGFPPIYRLKDLIDIFGADSHTARLDMQKIMSDASHLRVEVPAGIAPVAAVVAADSEVEANIAAALPSALRPNLMPAPLAVGLTKMRPDYASAKVIVDFRVCGARATPFPASQYLLSLAALRAVRPATRVVALCLIADPTQQNCRVSAAKTELAEALGVRAWYARDAQEAAQLVASAEGVDAEETEES